MTTGRASFRGATVALLEARLARETAAMVARFDGIPVPAPAVAEHPLDADDAVAACIERLLARPGAIVVLLTGVAVTRLFAAAERAQRDVQLAHALSRSVVVARGPKPSGALARRLVPVAVPVAEPFTTADVIAALEAIPVAGRAVLLVHYGERSDALLSALTVRGAAVEELMLYEWRLPDDTAPLSRAIDALVAGEIAVLAVTSQIQVRHLLQVAGPARRGALIEALNSRVLVGAVGPTCAAACDAAGIRAAVVPEHPKLAPLLAALAAAWEEATLRPTQREQLSRSRP